MDSSAHRAQMAKTRRYCIKFNLLPSTRVGIDQIMTIDSSVVCGGHIIFTSRFQHHITSQNAQGYWLNENNDNDNHMLHMDAHYGRILEFGTKVKSLCMIGIRHDVHSYNS